jgi:hypothetical protein
MNNTRAMQSNCQKATFSEQVRRNVRLESQADLQRVGTLIITKKV